MHRDANGAFHCGCEGFKKATTCKHIEALQRHLGQGPPSYYQDLEEDDLTYPQDWPRYKAATDIMDGAVKGLLRSLGRVQYPPYQRLTGGGRPRFERADFFLAIGLRAYDGASGRASQGTVRDLFESRILASRLGPTVAEPSTSSITTAMREADMFDAFKDALAMTGSTVAARRAVFALDSKEYNTPNMLSPSEGKVSDDALSRELWRATVKGHVLVHTESKLCVAASVTYGKSHDSLQLQPLVKSILGNFRISALAADKAYMVEDHLTFLDDFGIYAAIPPKSNNSATSEPRIAQQVLHWANRTEAEKDIYGMRQISESYHAMTARNTTDSLRSKTFSAQKTELMSMFVVVNCMRLVHIFIEDPTFDIPFMDADVREILERARAKVAHCPRPPKAPKLQRKSLREEDVA